MSPCRLLAGPWLRGGQGSSREGHAARSKHVSNRSFMKPGPTEPKVEELSQSWLRLALPRVALAAAITILMVLVAGLAGANEICTLDVDCLELEFCTRELGVCSGQGTCTVRPEVCIQVHKPVCGCDGTTYSNSCYAASAGVDVFVSEPCATIAKGVPGISSWQGIVVLASALASISMLYFRSVR